MLSTPSITPAQIGGYITAGLGLAATFGFNLSEPHTIEVMSMTGAMAIVLIFADKEIRKGRAMALSARVNNYSIKTAVEDAVLGAAPPLAAPDPAPSVPDAPVADAPMPIVDVPPVAPATIGQ